MKKKEIIKNTALELFNKMGYQSVTIRMIAEQLGISSGNLTYHYKKREDILEELYFDMVQLFDQRLKTIQLQDYTISSIKNEIKLSMEKMVQYHFFWVDSYGILSQNENIKAHFEKAYLERLEGYRIFYQKLNECGLIHPFTFAQEGELLAKRMLAYSNSWIYQSKLNHQMGTDDLIEYESNQLVLFLHPYFTEKGLEQWKTTTPF